MTRENWHESINNELKKKKWGTYYDIIEETVKPPIISVGSTVECYGVNGK